MQVIGLIGVFAVLALILTCVYRLSTAPDPGAPVFSSSSRVSRSVFYKRECIRRRLQIARGFLTVSNGLDLSYECERGSEVEE